jgi:hypothetical protein
MATDLSSYPVLLPILDCLNHARSHPVSWVVTSSPPAPSPKYGNVNSSSLHITLHLRAPTPTQAEVFNNYGPKPNSELLLGYGFVIPSNPEDTIVLKLGGSEQRHEIGRHASRHAEAGGMKSLWEEIEKMVLTSGEDDESVTSMEGGWEVALEVCEALDDMISQKIDALPDLSETPHLPSAGIRPEVRSMIAEYVKGMFFTVRRERAKNSSHWRADRAKGSARRYSGVRGYQKTGCYRKSEGIGTRRARSAR